MILTSSAEETVFSQTETSLAIGRYSLRISGPESVVGVLSDRWRGFYGPEHGLSGSIRVLIRENPGFLEGLAFRNGWHAWRDNDGHHMVYTRHGRAWFAVKSNAELTEFTVCCRKDDYNHAALGIQYAAMLALSGEYIGFHGVTLLCGNEIIILSAPSGTGKTTLSHLLEKHCDALAINGDFALLSPKPAGVVFEPTPFCGSSGRCLNHRVRVDRVVFLEQSPDNRWYPLTGRDAMVRFMSNTFVPIWDQGVRQTIQDHVMKCVSMLKLDLFPFVPGREAAEMFAQQLHA